MPGYTDASMFRRCGFALTLALLVSACSGPPTKEREQAVTAVQAAKAADAATYAPEELAAAEAALQQYDGAVAQRDYREALNFALQAKDHAYESARQAIDQKAATQRKADALVAELDALQKTAAARLAGTAAPHVTGPAADRLRVAQRAAGPALQEARSLVAQQNFLPAIRRLTPVIEALKRELSPQDAGRRGRSALK
jgi:hypothetical protein